VQGIFQRRRAFHGKSRTGNYGSAGQHSKFRDKRIPFDKTPQAP